MLIAVFPCDCVDVLRVKMSQPLELSWEIIIKKSYKLTV